MQQIRPCVSAANKSARHTEIKRTLVTKDKIRPLLRAIWTFHRKFSNWCRIDKWVIPSCLSPALALKYINKARHLEDISLDHCCSCSILSAFRVWHQIVISLLPPSSSPGVAAFRRDLPPCHSNLCLWNVQRSAPHCLNKETCYGDSSLASAPSHVTVIFHHVIKLKGIPAV